MDHLANCKPRELTNVCINEVYQCINLWGLKPPKPPSVYALAQFNQVLPSDDLFGYVSNISV